MTDFPPPPPPANVSPRRRVWRTGIQATLAGLVAVPSAVALLPLEAEDAAKVVGISGALVIVISAVWNAVDAHTHKEAP